MALEEGETHSLSRFIHPRIEPEIAFFIGKPISGKISLAEAAAAIDGLAPALEIIDSRYEAFKFNLADVVADNASSSGFIMGGLHSPSMNISNLGMIMSFDGRNVQIGSSAAILGHPLRSLVKAAELAMISGETIEPGDIVLAGAATEAVPINADSYVELSVCGMQNIGIHFGK